MNSWSVLRLVFWRACSIRSRRLRRFMLCWRRGREKAGVRPNTNKREKAGQVALEDEYPLPSCCRS